MEDQYLTKNNLQTFGAEPFSSEGVVGSGTLCCCTVALLGRKQQRNCRNMFWLFCFFVAAHIYRTMASIILTEREFKYECTLPSRSGILHNSDSFYKRSRACTCYFFTNMATVTGAQ